MSDNTEGGDKYHNAIRAAVEVYLDRKLTDDEFKDMRLKVDVIHRKENGRSILPDANFVIGDALFRLSLASYHGLVAKFSESQSAMTTRFSEVQNEFRLWMRKRVAMGFSLLVLATIACAVSAFEAGRYSATSDAMLRARAYTDVHLQALRKAATSEWLAVADTIETNNLARSPAAQREIRNLMGFCGTTIETRVARLNAETDVSTPKWNWKQLALIVGLTLPAVVLIWAVGFLFGRYRRFEKKNESLPDGY